MSKKEEALQKQYKDTSSELLALKESYYKIEVESKRMNGMYAIAESTLKIK